MEAVWERLCWKNATDNGASYIGIQALRVERRVIRSRQNRNRKTFEIPLNSLTVTKQGGENHENCFANVDAAHSWRGVSNAAIERCSEKTTSRENANRLCK